MHEGMLSNMNNFSVLPGTAIGTPRTARHQFASTSASGFESNTVLTPASLQSYHFEGGHSDPDYDLASGKVFLL